MMKDGSTGSRKIKRTLIYSAVLIAVYLFMILIAPGLTLWSAKAVSGASDDAVAVPVKAGDIYEYEFTMPYDRISGLVLWFSPSLRHTDRRMSPLKKFRKR